MATTIIPSDQPSIYAALTTLDNKAIVRPNNPPAGIAGFLFDLQADDEIHLQSDITDHYVEDNTAIQDHIALRPEEITLKGLVAELTDASPPANATAGIQDALPLADPMVPELTDMTDQIGAQHTDSTYGTALSPSLYDNYKNQAGGPPMTRQAQAFGYFYQLWKGRQLFSVETAFGTITNMAIMRLRSLQEAGSRFSSEFTVTFKKIRTAKDITVAAGQLAGRCAQQTATKTELGNIGIAPTQSESWLSQLANPSP